MPFTKTAKDIAIEDGVLWAELQLGGGDWDQASFPLENFIGIEDGKFALDAGGDGFVASAKDLEITVEPDKTLLRAMLPDGKGEFVAASFDLDAVLNNKDGKFEWIGWDSWMK